MKLGVVSDSHDHVKLLRRALDEFSARDVAAVLHAGDLIAPFSAKLLVGLDVPVYCIFGNNDGEKAGLKKLLPQLQYGPLRLELGGRTIVMHHFFDWLKPEDVEGADVVIGGHTHEIVHDMRGGVLYLNPGECCGVLTDRPTVAVLDTEDLSVETIDLA